MSTERDFVDYIVEQAGFGADLTFRRMFGEYAIYLDEKVVGFACDNCFFLKPSSAEIPELEQVPRRPPYPGAKNYPVIDEFLDDPETLRMILRKTEQALPLPEPKKNWKPTT